MHLNTPLRALHNVLLGAAGSLVIILVFALSPQTGLGAEASVTAACMGGCGICSQPERIDGGTLSDLPGQLESLPLLAPDPSWPSIRATGSISVHLPAVFRWEPDACQPISGESYAAIWVIPPPTDRPAEEHADLNLALRSYVETSDYMGLIDLPGAADDNAPQLPGLFGDDRTPTFNTVYQVYDWDWSTNSRGDLLTDPSVTLAGFATTPEEIIHVPSSGYDIGTALEVPTGGVMIGAGGYEVLVLYASAERITLKYTREDNVVVGYTIHIEGICVEPELLALYESWNDMGRDSLPALMAGQGIGRAHGNEIQVAIRDCGTFMDPRSRKDWWQGR